MLIYATIYAFFLSILLLYLLFAIARLSDQREAEKRELYSAVKMILLHHHIEMGKGLDEQCDVCRRLGTSGGGLC